MGHEVTSLPEMRGRGFVVVFVVSLRYYYAKAEFVIGTPSPPHIRTIDGSVRTGRWHAGTPVEL